MAQVTKCLPCRVLSSNSSIAKKIRDLLTLQKFNLVNYKKMYSKYLLTFLSWMTENLYLLNSTYPFLPPQARAMIILLSFSMNLRILDILLKCSYAVLSFCDWFISLSIMYSALPLTQCL
jgi:hypothetical protein